MLRIENNNKVVNLSYNLSPTLKEHLQNIDGLRRELLLTPIPQKTELRMRWEATLSRIYWSLSLLDNPLSKNDMIELLKGEGKKRPSAKEREVLNYKKALDFINQDWLVSQRPVTAKTVITLYETSCQPTVGRSIGVLFRASEDSLKQVLDYLQTGSEYPAVQAGIAQLVIARLRPFSDGNGRVARLLAQLFLYKSGYDFRGFLVLEEYWRRDVVALKELTAGATDSHGLTNWLEHFARGMQIQLEKTMDDAKDQRYQTELPAAFWELNERQKEILNQLERPDAKITNKDAQKLFRVSQITASRDLAKLVSLGLLFPHGGGRSRYYTKV